MLSGVAYQCRDKWGLLFFLTVRILITNPRASFHPTGHVDLRAEGRREDQHRSVSPQLWSQLPRLAHEGQSQLHAQSPKPGQSLHPDKQR